MNNKLVHHGILGMKWGVRRTKGQLGYKMSDNKNSENDNKKTNNKTQKYNSAKKNSVSDLSDAELKERISRLEMEKKYSDLITASNPQKGKKFVVNVLERSGQNIATQFTTYVLGRGVNKVFEGVFKDPAIVNPKKGQKDK
jgi:hypothetical protein